ncbi:MAG: outer membrane lipoprotein carrier protein LolA, partial [Phycisphaerae bacterium]|nr:outer membrane lipoprotein carrier protein LolA [Gemmatimonadaceae bacterium]
ASTLRLTREEIVQSQGERVTSRLSSRDEPTVGVISELLFSVLAGDFKRLQSGFKIDAAAQPATWRARLVPKESGMRRVISAIELSGSDYVRQLTLFEASGDRTTISFTDMVAGRSALQPEEARAFGMTATSGGFER